MLPAVAYGGRPVRVRFLGRPTRYTALVRPLGGRRTIEVHVPNPGRMEELLVPEETVGYVVPVPGTHRRTQFDFVSVRHGRSLVSIDSRIGNRLVARALGAGRLRGFGSGPWTPEFPWEGHRLDFAIPGAAPSSLPAALLEVKSSNLRVGDTALFPDAPTERGRRHVELLGEAARRGIRAGLLFVVQRSDVRRFAPNAWLDPDFAAALARSRRLGLRVRARCVRVLPNGLEWGNGVPVVNR